MNKRTINVPAAALPVPMTKSEAVQAEQFRLMELFAGADPNKLDFVRDAVNQLAWLGIAIVELQSEIDERGVVVPYDNGGNQRGLQANPACKILKDYQQLYNTLFRALLPVLPDKPRRPGKLAEFMNDYNPEEFFPCDDLPLDTDNV